MERHKRLIYELLTLLVVGIWGMTFVSTKVLINNGLHPVLIFAIRFIIAYIGIWLITAFQKRKIHFLSNSLRDELLFIILGICGGSIYFLAENTALEYTQACNVSFIVCSTPLITTLLTVLTKKLFKGKLADGLEETSISWKLAIGTIMALGGMSLMLFNGYNLKLSPKGDFLAIIAALCWGIYSILMSAMTEKYGAMFSTRKVFFYGLVTIIPFILCSDESYFDWSIIFQTSNLLNLIFLGVFASLLCFVTWNIIMLKLGNVTATNHVYLNPIFTLIGSMIFLGETMTLMSAAGSACILAGVVIASWKKTNSFIRYA